MQRLVFIFLACAAGAQAQDTSLDDSLAAVSSVGNEGAGHRQAISGWNSISKSSVDSLPVILKAIEDDKPLATNWLRAAVDQIAERAVQNGRKLPNEQLQQIVFSADYAPRARRIAYEWLVRVDKAAEQRIIPKMLNDSSLEMRRDAVAMTLEQAEAADSSDEKKRLYALALTSARDTDQIDAAFEKLTELGGNVDLPTHFGFITNWKLIGPFDNTDKGGFAVAYPPERELDFDKKYAGKKSAVTWVDHQTKDKYGMVNLNEAIGKNMGAAGYAVTTFESAKEQEVDFRLGCINAAKVWVNGELLIEREVYHSGTKIDQYVKRGKLKAGQNTILLKVCQNEQTENWAQDWQFQFRVCDKVGTAILASNRPAPAE